MDKTKIIITMGRQVDYCIEFKLMYEQARELERIYGVLLTNYEYEDDHEALLCDHLKDMYCRLKDLTTKMEGSVQKKRKLAMNNSEARAFFLLWTGIDTSKWPLANVILCDMIKKIDKTVKNARVHARG